MSFTTIQVRQYTVPSKCRQQNLLVLQLLKVFLRVGWFGILYVKAKSKGTEQTNTSFHFPDTFNSKAELACSKPWFGEGALFPLKLRFAVESSAFGLNVAVK